MSHNIAKMIYDFVPAGEGTESVSVCVAGTDEWSVTKALELIRAAPMLYDALNRLVDHTLALDETIAAGNNLPDCILNAQRAIAAAKGAVLQRDRLAKKKERTT